MHNLTLPADPRPASSLPPAQPALDFHRLGWVVAESRGRISTRSRPPRLEPKDDFMGYDLTVRWCQSFGKKVKHPYENIPLIFLCKQCSLFTSYPLTLSYIGTRFGNMKAPLVKILPSLGVCTCLALPHGCFGFRVLKQLSCCDFHDQEQDLFGCRTDHCPCTCSCARYHVQSTSEPISITAPSSVPEHSLGVHARSPESLVSRHSLYEHPDLH